MSIESRLRTLVGFKPKGPGDYDKPIADLKSEIDGYRSELAGIEKEIEAFAERLSELAESDEDLKSVRAKMDVESAAESRARANLDIVKRRIENRQEKLNWLYDQRLKAVAVEERRLAVFSAQAATVAMAEFVTLAKRACAAYQVGREHMVDADRHAVGAGLKPGFLNAVENRAVTFCMDALFRIFGSHSHRIRVQSAPYVLRKVDHVEHLAALLARQLRGGGQNGNGKMDEEQDENSTLEAESATTNENGGAES
jgi:hypothetical protein